MAKTVGLSDDIGRFRADPAPVVLSDDVIERFRVDADVPDFDQDVCCLCADDSKCLHVHI